MAKIIKIAIYKEGKRTFEEIDYDLYQSLLNSTSNVNTRKAGIKDSKISTTEECNCTFKLAFKNLLKRIRKWRWK